jgi:hypothetical protein
MKTRTIGQTVIQCYGKAEKDQFESNQLSFRVDRIYDGPVSKLTHDACLRFATLHPNYAAYYDHALAILWRGKGILSRGNESAVMAVKSCLPENTYYVIVFNPLRHEK